MLQNSWNLNPSSRKCLKILFLHFLALNWVIYAQKINFRYRFIFSLVVFFNLESFFHYLWHFSSIITQKSIIFSFQNIFTVVECIFNSWTSNLSPWFWFLTIYLRNLYWIVRNSGSIFTNWYMCKPERNVRDR